MKGVAKGEVGITSFVVTRDDGGVGTGTLINTYNPQLRLSKLFLFPSTSIHILKYFRS